MLSRFSSSEVTHDPLTPTSTSLSEGKSNRVSREKAPVLQGGGDGNTGRGRDMHDMPVYDMPVYDMPVYDMPVYTGMIYINTSIHTYIHVSV